MSKPFSSGRAQTANECPEAEVINGSGGVTHGFTYVMTIRAGHNARYRQGKILEQNMQTENTAPEFMKGWRDATHTMMATDSSYIITRAAGAAVCNGLGEVGVKGRGPGVSSQPTLRTDCSLSWEPPLSFSSELITPMT